MTTYPSIDFLNDIRRRTDAAIDSGTDPTVLADVLLETSRETAMKGGPVRIYQHSYRMECAGLELRAEFDARFPDLDKDALIKGEIKRI